MASDHAEHINRHDYVSQDPRLKRNEHRTFLVLVVTLVTMTGEIIAGYMTGSMALLADGWHMSSHAVALLVSFLAYRLAQNPRVAAQFTFGTGKLIPLGGFTSALLLACIALIMCAESVERIFNPREIHYFTALGVSAAGLFVNLVCAWILHDPHHHHDHEVHDHNHHSAFVHVLTDAFTSVLAILGLLAGLYMEWAWADPAVGVLGGFVVFRWSYVLLKSTGLELMDMHVDQIPRDQVQKLFAGETDVSITDLHAWKIAPKTLACEVVICSDVLRGCDYYRAKILSQFSIQHLVIDERLCATAQRSTPDGA
jgi:cation diffusion facilitator family transporter